MKIFLDDKRIQPDDSWTLVTTFQDFVTLYDKSAHSITAISFDHDLGMSSDGDGNDALRHVEYCYYEYGILPPSVLLCHSANPVGKAEIERGIAALLSRVESE